MSVVAAELWSGRTPFFSRTVRAVWRKALHIDRHSTTTVVWCTFIVFDHRNKATAMPVRRCLWLNKFSGEAIDWLSAELLLCYARQLSKAALVGCILATSLHRRERGLERAHGSERVVETERQQQYVAGEQIMKRYGWELDRG